ncbi:MAG: class II aldolase/adducin family protein [Spirochaetes bacterium]|nr:class II aldolase/adducin family protein [Spirochaetota bacterium]
MKYKNERTAVADCMRRLYRQGLTTTSGGNISLRVTDEHVLLTASKFDKGELNAGQVGILKMTGENLTPELSPSIEAGMHLAIYKCRPDIRAVVHAHPVTASAFTASKTPLNTRLIAESYAIVGTPGYAPYALMGTPALASSVAETARSHNCILMANHGVIALGKSLIEAFDRLEVLEAAARLSVIAAQIGNTVELDEKQLDEIDGLMGR